MGVIGNAASASPIKSIQTGYVSDVGTPVGGGEEAYYTDVTISAVNTSKVATLEFIGGFAAGPGSAVRDSGASDAAKVIPKLTTSTNLRLATPSGALGSNVIAGRWRIVEYV
jgi:hypothetical protein